MDAVLAVTRSMVRAAMKPPDPAAGEPTAAQYRALGVLTSPSRWRLGDLAEALGVAQSSAGRMCGRLARKGLVRRHRASGDRRTVLVSLTAAGEVPGSQRPGAAPAGASVLRPPVRQGRPGPPVPPVRLSRRSGHDCR